MFNQKLNKSAIILHNYKLFRNKIKTGFQVKIKIKRETNFYKKVARIRF